MLKLGWDTRGRLSREDYRAAQTKLGISSLVAVILGAGVVLGFTKQNTYVSLAVVAVVIAGLLYLQYRDAQLAIRRLHDRNLPGWLLWPIMLFTLAVIGTTSTVLMGALYEGGLMRFLWTVWELAQPLVGLAFSLGGYGLLAAAAMVAYSLFIQYNLNANSRPGPNRYDSAPAE
jgi:uncharacterized membrane protein YhaH (DUF805 family)